MSQHTPGPWTATQPPNDPNAWDICAGFMIASLKWNPKSEADARLIAAAPDLLTAALYAVGRLEALGAEDDKEAVGQCPALRALRAAIAKAEGED